jgi:hypothetical protein
MNLLAHLAIPLVLAAQTVTGAVLVIPSPHLFAIPGATATWDYIVTNRVDPGDAPAYVLLESVQFLEPFPAGTFEPLDLGGTEVGPNDTVFGELARYHLTPDAHGSTNGFLFVTYSEYRRSPADTGFLPDVDRIRTSHFGLTPASVSIASVPEPPTVFTMLPIIVTVVLVRMRGSQRLRGREHRCSWTRCLTDELQRRHTLAACSWTAAHYQLVENRVHSRYLPLSASSEKLKCSGKNDRSDDR